MMEERCCIGCGQNKPIGEFAIRPRGLRRSSCRACERKRLAIWRERNRSRFRETKADWQAKNGEKRAAHKAVERALRIGEMVAQPCERCGTDHNVHAHHDDYARPLEVKWLCPLHHGERHRELRAVARPSEVEVA